EADQRRPARSTRILMGVPEQEAVGREPPGKPAGGPGFNAEIDPLTGLPSGFTDDRATEPDACGGRLWGVVTACLHGVNPSCILRNCRSKRLSVFGPITTSSGSRSISARYRPTELSSS